jgi:hypothetical protein
MRVANVTDNAWRETKKKVNRFNWPFSYMGGTGRFLEFLRFPLTQPGTEVHFASEFLLWKISEKIVKCTWRCLTSKWPSWTGEGEGRSPSKKKREGRGEFNWFLQVLIPSFLIPSPSLLECYLQSVGLSLHKLYHHYK